LLRTAVDIPGTPDIPDPGPVAAWPKPLSVARLLKAFLRSYGFRCVSIEEVSQKARAVRKTSPTIAQDASGGAKAGIVTRKSKEHQMLQRREIKP
jgi:hypothetical protein